MIIFVIQELCKIELNTFLKLQIFWEGVKKLTCWVGRYKLSKIDIPTEANTQYWKKKLSILQAETCRWSRVSQQIISGPPDQLTLPTPAPDTIHTKWSQKLGQ